jgi:small GTP-binding protein
MAKVEDVNKVVIVGESGVGKTCIMAQFIENKFEEEFVSSLTTQYRRKKIQLVTGEDVTFDIYDTAGQEKYRAIAKLYYKNARVVILVYDITDIKSFEAMKNYWYEQVKDIQTENLILAIAANKSDLYEERQVENETGEEFAKSINAIFVETSAKNDSGIDKLFENIGYKILDPNFNFYDEEEKKRKKYKKKKKKEEEEEKVENDEKKEKDQNGEKRESFRVTNKTFKEPKKNSKSGCC